jgi:hypothetical protein
MNVKINQNQLSRFLNKFSNEIERDKERGLFTKILKFLRINGKDEEIGKYILNQIKLENIQNYDYQGDIITSIQFSINTFPLNLTAHRIFFNKGGRDYDFELTSPIFGEENKLDLSYSLLNKIYKELFNYR